MIRQHGCTEGSDMPRKKATPSKPPPKGDLSDLATKDFLKMMKMVLKDGNSKRADAWFRRVGDRDPERGVRLYIEMLKYSHHKPH